MPESIQKMNHYFMVDDNHGNMYRIGAQGDVSEIESELKKTSRNVRYVGSKEEDRVVRGRTHKGFKFVSCRYQYKIGVKWLGAAG